MGEVGLKPTSLSQRKHLVRQKNHASYYFIPPFPHISNNYFVHKTITNKLNHQTKKIIIFGYDKN